MKTEEINIAAVVNLAKAAGAAIMKIYNSEIKVTYKGDESPLTQADLASHNCICAGLAELTPSIPVLSEESTEFPAEERLSWNRFWLVDPLDGTKEFIKRNGEFTVNIALIDNGVPVMGVVYAPDLDICYWGVEGEGAFKQQHKKPVVPMHVAEPPEVNQIWRVVGSRSHESDEFLSFVAKLPESEIVAMGSSLKLCIVADGGADLYPRLGPTCEWDTAAADAVVRAAGGQVLNADTLLPLGYNQRDTLLNPHFIVCADKDPAWATQ
jgi:3'(2'), 5'-bisphosphate nucleotidase